MFPEDIDDLFREKLDGHASPPGDDLWARLQATPPAGSSTDVSEERLDQLFQKGLNAHATPPRRELWERLEDEHLRPRRRRPAAWWPMAIAAAVALLLVVGGLGLWNNPGLKPAQTATVTSRPSTGQNQQNTETGSDGLLKPSIASSTGRAADEARKVENNVTPVQKNLLPQATRPADVASSAPKARTSAAGPALRHPLGTYRQPDAAAVSPQLVAGTSARPKAPATQPQAAAADESRLTQSPVVAAINTPVPAAEIVPARLVPATEVITVDVRSGAAPRPAAIVTSALAAVTEPEERRRLGGRLLQQAGHLVRGERMSLAEVTGLPETVTVRATVAGHSLTKSIQL